MFGAPSSVSLVGEGSRFSSGVFQPLSPLILVSLRIFVRESNFAEFKPSKTSSIYELLLKQLEK